MDAKTKIGVGKRKWTNTKNYVIVFKDRNKINVNIENLAIVSRGELARLNQNNLFSIYPEITEAGINVPKLIQKVSERKNKK